MKTPLILLATIALVAGCAMVNVTPYDPVVADRATQLAKRTNEMLADGDAGRLSLAQSQQFLEQSLGLVRALHTRATQTHKSTFGSSTLMELEKEYEALLARKRPIRSSAARPLLLKLYELQRTHEAWRLHEERRKAREHDDPFPTPDDTHEDDRSKCKKDGHEDRNCPRERR